MQGISEDFLKVICKSSIVDVILTIPQNQLFQPFSQENPLQPGTGLGLAIVNSIVRSESVNGKIDVWSAENFGTEIRITFEAQVVSEVKEGDDLGDWSKDRFSQPPLISLLGFSETRGQRLLKNVLMNYLQDWWHFRVSTSESQLGDIIMVNEEVDIVRQLVERRKCSRPLILISSARGDPYVISAMDAYERSGGFARIMFKPIGPNSLRAVLKPCLPVLQGVAVPQLRTSASRSSFGETPISSPGGERYISRDLVLGNSLSRRRSDGADPGTSFSQRPGLHRSMTQSHLSKEPSSYVPSTAYIREDSPDAPDNPTTTVPVGPGGLLLKTSIGTLDSAKPITVLVVEDNSILRELL